MDVAARDVPRSSTMLRRDSGAKRGSAIVLTVRCPKCALIATFLDCNIAQAKEVEPEYRCVDRTLYIVNGGSRRLPRKLPPLYL